MCISNHSFIVGWKLQQLVISFFITTDPKHSRIYESQLWSIRDDRYVDQIVRQPSEWNFCSIYILFISLYYPIIYVELKALFDLGAICTVSFCELVH